MLKLRLKRAGRKRSPSYRLVIMENRCRRDGRPIDEVGYYNPISKQYNFEVDKILLSVENQGYEVQSIKMSFGNLKFCHVSVEFFSDFKRFKFKFYLKYFPLKWNILI